MATYYSFGKNGIRRLARDHTIPTLRSDLANMIRNDGIDIKKPIYFWTGPKVKTESGILLVIGFTFYWVTRDNVYEYYLYSDGEKMEKIRLSYSISEIKKLLKE